MSEPFIGEIRPFGFNFPPRNWAACNGQLLSISQNTALFSILGTTYGGNGITTFGLPNLQGCFPISRDQGPGLNYRTQGETGGSQTETLQTTAMPMHNHMLNCSTTPANQTTPAGNVPAAGAGQRGAKFYANAPGTPVQMNATTLTPTGGGLPHNNMPPYLAVNYCIAINGIYPSRP
jgi:microcystin-dependent protein